MKKLRGDLIPKQSERKEEIQEGPLEKWIGPSNVVNSGKR